MPQRKLTSMLPEASESLSSLPNSPNTRKRQLDYASLAKHGLQGPPQVSQLSPTPNRKRLQLSSKVIDFELSQFGTQSTNNSQVISDTELLLLLLLLLLLFLLTSFFSPRLCRTA